MPYWRLSEIKGCPSPSIQAIAGGNFLNLPIMDPGNKQPALGIGEPDEEISEQTWLGSSADSLEPLILGLANEKVDRLTFGQLFSREISASRVLIADAYQMH